MTPQTKNHRNDFRQADAIRLIDSYEPTPAQLAEQYELGHADGWNRRPNRYANDPSRLALSYQRGWKQGKACSDEVDGMTCIES